MRPGSPFWRVLFALGVVLQLIVLYVPRTPSTGGLPTDKVVHAVIFGGVLWLGVMAGLPRVPLIIVLCAHAVASELIQHFVLPNRSGDVLDVAADVSGVLIVTLLARLQAPPAATPG